MFFDHRFCMHRNVPEFNMVPEEKTIGNFRTLWLKFDVTSSDRHQLFYKEHSVRNQEPEYPKGKTLFVLNIPLYIDLNSLKAAFSQHCGHVKFAKFQSGLGSTKTGFKIAYIVFSKDSALEKALSLPQDFTIVLNTGESICILGIQKYSKVYNSIAAQNEKELKDSIEKFMAAYDSRMEEKSTVKDDDEDNGWTTVSSKKKRGQFAPARKESTIDKLQNVEERRSKKKQLLNFYTFQIRESKKQHLAELRKKFELDKKKLEQLKAKRTFKPFV